jgi:hypothetical protein
MASYHIDRDGRATKCHFSLLCSSAARSDHFHSFEEATQAYQKRSELNLEDETYKLTPKMIRATRFKKLKDEHALAFKLSQKFGSQRELIQFANRRYYLSFRPGRENPVLLTFSVIDEAREKGPLHGSVPISATSASLLSKSGELLELSGLENQSSRGFRLRKTLINNINTLSLSSF